MTNQINQYNNNQYNSGLETTVYDTFRNIPMETKTVPIASEIEQIADEAEVQIPTKPRSKKGLETKHLVYAGIAAAAIGIIGLAGIKLYEAKKGLELMNKILAPISKAYLNNGNVNKK